MNIHGAGTVCAGAQGVATVRINTMPDGKKVANFNISVSNGKDKKTGEWKPSLFFSVSCFGFAAEDAERLEAKDKVYVEGYMSQQDTWTDRQGVARTTLKLTASAVHKLERKDPSTAHVPTETGRPAASAQQRTAGIEFAESLDDFPDMEGDGEIPF